MNDPEEGTRPLRSKPGDDNDYETTQDAELSDRIREFMEEPRTESSPSAAEILAQLQQQTQIDLKDKDDATTEQLRMVPKLATDIQPWRVIFQVMSHDAKVVGVDVQDVAVVGRSDPQGNIEPDLDLSEYDAQSLGVSRRHAILLPSDEGLCLLDLDSTNGTWINGVYLQPGQKYRLRSGDRVEFGRLRLVVRVVGAMLQGGSADDSETAVTRPKPKRS